MTVAEALASEAFEACGSGLDRDAFGIFTWCTAELEEAAWIIYRTIQLH